EALRRAALDDLALESPDGVLPPYGPLELGALLLDPEEAREEGGHVGRDLDEELGESLRLEPLAAARSRILVPRGERGVGDGESAAEDLVEIAKALGLEEVAEGEAGEAEREVPSRVAATSPRGGRLGSGMDHD